MGMNQNYGPFAGHHLHAYVCPSIGLEPQNITATFDSSLQRGTVKKALHCMQITLYPKWPLDTWKQKPQPAQPYLLNVSHIQKWKAPARNLDPR